MYGRRTSFHFDVTVIVERGKFNAIVMLIYSMADSALAALWDDFMHSFSLRMRLLTLVMKRFASEMSLAGICDGP